MLELLEASQAVAQNLPTSQRLFAQSSFSGNFLCSVALLCSANSVYDNLVSFQLYGLLLSSMPVLVKLFRVVTFICANLASTTTSLPRASRTTTFSLSLGSMTPTSLQRPMLSTNPRPPASISASSTPTLYTSALWTHSWGTNLCSFCFSTFLGWVALACPCESLNLSTNLAQRRSLSSSLSSFSLSFSSNLEAPSMSSFKHAELLQVLLANEAYSLPPSLLQHTLGGKLLTQELAEQPEELTPESFKAHLPQLLAEDELEFYMVLGQSAMESFKDTGFDKLPRQKVPGASNANLGNWQASSSFAKAVTFWAWTACRAPELLSKTAYVINLRLKVKSFSESVAALKLRNNITVDFRGADCQLCLWGKQRASEEQPSFSILGIQLGAMVVQLSPFEQI